MKGPLCRLCGNEHWPREPHIWKGVEPTACAECVAKDQRIANLTAQVSRLEREIVDIKLSTSIHKPVSTVDKAVHNGVDTLSTVDKPLSTSVDMSTDRKAYKREWMRQDRARRKCSS